MVLGFERLLTRKLVTIGEPTSGHNDENCVGTPKGAFCRTTVTPHFRPQVDMDFRLAQGLYFSFGSCWSGCYILVGPDPQGGGIISLCCGSCAQFLAVVNPCSGWVHRSSNSEKGSVFGLGACMPGSDPSLVTDEFMEFFRLSRDMKVTALTGDGGVVHLFVVYMVTRGRRRTRRSSPLLICCSVLAEDQVVFVGRPMGF